MQPGKKGPSSISPPMPTGPRQPASTISGPAPPTNVSPRPFHLLPHAHLPPDVLADANKTVLPYPAAPIPFRTFPDPRLQSARRFRFVASSCTVPNFPYRGPFHKRSIKGFDLLADYLHAKSQPQPRHHASAHTQDVLLNDTTPVDALNATAPDDQTYSVVELEEPVPTEFMLFLGDFIYADVPFYGGDDKEAYRRLYRRNYQSTSYRRIYEQLRASAFPFHLLAYTNTLFQPSSTRMTTTKCAPNFSSLSLIVTRPTVHRQLRRPGRRPRALRQRL
jgi:hypothetical protein